MTVKRRAYPKKYSEDRAKLIRKTRPWQKATGPKTMAGKATSARNALKHGLYSADIYALRRLLKIQAANLSLLTPDKNNPGRRFSLGFGSNYATKDAFER